MACPRGSGLADYWNFGSTSLPGASPEFLVVGGGALVAVAVSSLLWGGDGEVGGRDSGGSGAVRLEEGGRWREEVGQ